VRPDAYPTANDAVDQHVQRYTICVTQADDSRAELVGSLLVASRALLGVAARSLAEADHVTLPQFRALVVLSSRPGATVSELAEALDIHPTTATRLCDRLVAKQLIRRTEGVHDRRITEIRLAAAGRRLVQKVTARRVKALNDIASRMDSATWEAATAVLTAFAQAAGEGGQVDLFGWDAALS